MLAIFSKSYYCNLLLLCSLLVRLQFELVYGATNITCSTPKENSIPPLLTMYFDGLYRKTIFNYIEEARSHLPCFNINIVNDIIVHTIVERYWPLLGQIYPQITLPSCKSDIARLALIYEYGGYYMDTHTSFKNNGSLFSEWHSTIDPSYDFIISGVAQNTRLVNRFLAGKRKSSAVKALVDVIQHRIIQHYYQECTTNHYVPYDLLKLTGIDLITHSICQSNSTCSATNNNGK